MKSTLLLITMTLLLMVSITGCTEEPIPCPTQIYPSLEGIDKIPRTKLIVKDGILTHEGTKNAFNTMKALRASENYYYALIERYRKEFL